MDFCEDECLLQQTVADALQAREGRSSGVATIFCRCSNKCFDRLYEYLEKLCFNKIENNAKFLKLSWSSINKHQIHSQLVKSQILLCSNEYYLDTAKTEIGRKHIKKMIEQYKRMCSYLEKEK